MKTTKSSMANLRSLALVCALASSAAATRAADYSTTLSSLNPLGYWRLNEPTQPVVPTYPMANSSAAGAALNGLYYGVPVLGQLGALASEADTAAEFGALAKYAEVPYSAALNPSTSFTVEFWAKRTNSSTSTASVLCNFGPSRSNGYLVFAGNGDLKWTFRTYNGTTRGSLISTAPIVQDEWTHVVCVHDGTGTGTNSIYINGVLDSTLSPAPYAPQTVSNLRIGVGPNNETPAWSFPGLLDDMAIYPAALSDAQIATHYEAATNATPATAYRTLVLSDGAAAYWRLNEAAFPPYIPYAATNAGSLGSALDGAYSPGSTSGVAGPLRSQFAGFASDNKAVALNGTSGQIDIPGFATTTDTVTIVGWIKRNGTQVGTSPLLFQRASGSPATGLVVNFTDRLAYSWNDDAGSYNYNPGPDFYIPDGVWTFAALSVTPTDATIYIGGTNGLKSATRTAEHLPHDFSGGPLAIGRDTGSGSRFVKGNLDEIALFDTALDFATISNLFYSATPAIPMVVRAPADPLYEGMSITFTAYGVGNVPVTYQWRKNGGNLTGKVASTLVLNSATVGDSGNYDVVVTGGSLSVTSAVSAITVVAGPPIIVQQPVSATRYAGAAVTFGVTIQGSVPWSFEWKKGATAIADATNSTYTIPTLTAADAGSYSVTIGNPHGSTNSAAATLTVLPVDNYAAQVIYSGAGAYWQMNEKAGTTAIDYAGGRNCTIVGPVTNNVVSVRPPTYAGYDAGNTGFAFSGTNSVDYLVTATPLNFTNTSITMAGWVMPYTGLLGMGTDVNFVANVGGVGLNSAGTDGAVRAHPLWGSDTGLFFSFDTWNYIAVVWTPSGQTFYLDNGDGSGLRAKSVSGTIDPNIWKGLPFYIARQADRTDRGWPGQIDELALFDRALTPAEVTNLYLAAISGPAAPSIVTQPASQPVFVGQSATFTVGTLGGLPMTYQWKRNGADLPGATGKTLTLSDIYYTDAASYSVGITNAQGFANSQPALLTVAAPPTFANLTNALVLHLRFDDDVQDSSGRDNHGTIVGTTNYVAGTLGSALHYNTDKANETYNYVTLGVPADLQFGYDTNFSVAYWVKFTGLPGDLPFLCSAANSYGNFGLTFAPSYTRGGWSFWLGGDMGGDGLYGADASINDGDWHSLVHTFNRTGDAITYLDGVQVDARSIASVGSVDSGLPILIGQAPNGDYQEDGEAAIDDLGIWQRALSSTEAQAIYQVGVQGKSFDTYGPVTLKLQKSGDDLELIWESGTLQSADEIGGPFNPVDGAAAPYHKVSPGPGKKFYRVKL